MLRSQVPWSLCRSVQVAHGGRASNLHGSFSYRCMNGKWMKIKVFSLQGAARSKGFWHLTSSILHSWSLATILLPATSWTKSWAISVSELAFLSILSSRCLSAVEMLPPQHSTCLNGWSHRDKNGLDGESSLSPPPVLEAALLGPFHKLLNQLPALLPSSPVVSLVMAENFCRWLCWTWRQQCKRWRSRAPSPGQSHTVCSLWIQVERW